MLATWCVRKALVDARPSPYCVRSVAPGVCVPPSKICVGDHNTCEVDHPRGGHKPPTYLGRRPGRPSRRVCALVDGRSISLSSACTSAPGPAEAHRAVSQQRGGRLGTKNASGSAAIPHQESIDSEGVQGGRLFVQSLRHGRGQTQGDRAARRPAVIACDVLCNQGQSVFIKAG